MSVEKLACISCGAPLMVAPKADSLSCPYCGTRLAVRRYDGEAALTLAQQINQAVYQSRDETQAAIHAGTQATQTEIKRLELKQELSLAQLQLTNVQAEIRRLERDKKSRNSQKELKALRQEEKTLLAHILALQIDLGATGSQPGGRLVSQSVPAAKSGSGFGCLIKWTVLIFIVFPILLALWAYLGIPIVLAMAVAFYFSEGFRQGAYQRMSWLNKLPGFGAGNPKSMAIATLIYLLPLSIWFTLSIVATNAPKPTG